MGKDSGSHGQKGLEAAKDLEAEEAALPWLAGMEARGLRSLPVVTLGLNGHRTWSERAQVP